MHHCAQQPESTFLPAQSPGNVQASIASTDPNPTAVLTAVPTDAEGYGVTTTVTGGSALGAGEGAMAALGAIREDYAESTRSVGSGACTAAEDILATLRAMKVSL